MYIKQVGEKSQNLDLLCLFDPNYPTRLCDRCGYLGELILQYSFGKAQLEEH